MSNNNSTSRLLYDFVDNEVDDVDMAFEELKTSIALMESPKAQLYRALNPQLSVHPVYVARPGVNELERISWSRLRLSAHSLAIEQGRWNRRGRGRLPIEERLCSCGEVQTEAHVFESCPRSLALRENYQITSLVDMMVARQDFAIICECVHKILSLY